MVRFGQNGVPLPPKEGWHGKYNGFPEGPWPKGNPLDFPCHPDSGGRGNILVQAGKS